MLRLRHGASKERLEIVVKRMGQHVESGPSVALVRSHDRSNVTLIGGIVIHGDVLTHLRIMSFRIRHRAHLTGVDSAI